MKRKAENGKGAFHTSQKALQAQKENLFLKYSHVQPSSSYKGYPYEARSAPAEMKEVSEKTESDKMSSQGENRKESEKKSVCLEKAPTAKKVLCDNKRLDETLDDFQESQIILKQKIRKKQANETFACIVCQSDITHLDLNERAIHINQCIDGQSLAVIPSEETTAESAFILDCPLCFKHFPTPEVRSAHIKKCGRSRGLSTQSVIQALRLQEKHVLERRALGLPLNNKPARQPKKPAPKKFLIKPKSAMESDIHLAKALSLSLKESESKTTANFDSAGSEDGIQSAAILQAPSEFQNPGKFVSKKTLKPSPLLLLRSEEERQKILLEKVNSVIASLREFKSGAVIEDNQYDTIEQKRTFLWTLCGAAEGKKSYYVEQLLDWISPSDVEVGSKLCNLSQVAGHHILTQLPCDYTFTSADQTDEGSEVHEESESPSLIKSLRSLIGNSWMSDVDIHTASGIVIPAHKLFLALRCPSLKNAFDQPVPSGRHVVHWESTSFDAALHFLNFIYTGSADWKEDIIDELYQLAVKYEVHDLLNILESNKETLEMLICEDVKENTEDSIMDTEVSLEGNNQDSKESVEKKHISNEKNKIADMEFRSADSSFSKDKVHSNVTTCANRDILGDFSDQDDIVCIQDTEPARETIVIENIPQERDDVDEEILILNKHEDSYADIKEQTYNLNLETLDTDSMSSNSCKIVKTRTSSESKTYFDTFQEDVINIVCSGMPHTSEGSIYCTSSYTTPSRTLADKISPSFKGSIPSGNVTSPKISPCASLKSTSTDCISHKTLPCCKGVNTNSPRNSPSSFSKDAFKNVGSSEKSCDSLPNFRNEKMNEAIIILENEHDKSGMSEANRSSLVNEIFCVDNPENRIFSPKKVSPGKVSKMKSPSFNDMDAVSKTRNLFVENKRVYSELHDFGVQHTFQKDSSVSPGTSRFPSSREILLNCYALSPKSGPEICDYNKDKSFKRNLDCSLNDDVYPMHSLSSPEILVCDSDNEMEEVVEKSLSSKTDYDWEKRCSPNQEVETVHCSETPDSVFTSDFKENSSTFGKDKTAVPEIICCHSDDDDPNVTVKFQSTCAKNEINFNTITDLNGPEFIQKVEFSGEIENKCTPVETNKNIPVLDVVDCCSNSNDNEYAVEKLQSLNQAIRKEATVEDEDEFIPLSERIEAAKSKSNSNKCFEDRVPSSPESPWTFQTDNKHCGSGPQAKDQNTLKRSASSSQQSYDSTPKHLPKQSKNSETGKQGDSSSAPNGLQPKFKISDSPVTPLPDYKSMVTPDLKQALKRVGVKPLPRKKAVAVLSHIYNETHPWNDGNTEESLESQTESSSKSTKNLSLPKKRKQPNETSDRPSKKTAKSHPATATQAEVAATKINSKPKNSSNKIKPSSSGQINPLEAKTSSPDTVSSPSGSNNSRENYFNLSSDFSDSSQPDSKDNIMSVSQYILQNDDLYKKVLTYSPLNLMEFQHELKENGISISVKNLMDYLDEQCITFTCPRKEEYKKKQQARTQRFRKRMIAKMSQQKS